METRLPKSTLFVGLLTSLVLHATLLVPALVAVMNSEAVTPRKLMARVKPEDFRPPETEPDVKLGIEESQASTMTWIGYEDYQEHMAALSEVEQAAFQTTPTGAQPAPAADAQPQPPQEVAEAPQGEPPPEPPKPPDPIEEIESWMEAHLEGPGPVAGDPTRPDAKPAAIEDVLEKLDEMLTEETKPDEQPKKPVEAAAQQPQQEPKEQVQDAPPSPETPQPAGEPGEQSDLESQATSTVDVPIDKLRLGHPFAAQGLRLKPRRPVFTPLVLLTAAPANPRVELRFRRDGVVAHVRFLQRTGDPRIDEALESSLYRWRAAGKKLAALSGNETIAIEIRILLR